MEHALIQPSSASRWVPCPGSVSMEALYPEVDREEAIEGTLAASVCAALIKGEPVPDGATEEMLDGAELLIDDLQSVLVGREPGMRLVRVEERAWNPTAIHTDNWGTPDLTMLDISTNQFFVWDYKFGHRHVEVYENWQLLNYVALKLHGVYGTATTDQLNVHMRIVQPRSYHRDGPVREWVIPYRELEPYFEILRQSAKLSLMPHPPTLTNSGCRDCKARHACSTLQSGAYQSVHLAGQAIPFDMPAEAVGRELAVMMEAQEILKARISGLENETLSQIKQGVAITGWGWEQGMGREAWSKPIDEVLALGQMMGVNVAKPSAITPKQAIKAGIPAAVVAEYSTTPKGEIKLVRDTGARARKIFQGVAK